MQSLLRQISWVGGATSSFRQIKKLGDMYEQEGYGSLYVVSEQNLLSKINVK